MNKRKPKAKKPSNHSAGSSQPLKRGFDISSSGAISGQLECLRSVVCVLNVSMFYLALYSLYPNICKRFLCSPIVPVHFSCRSVATCMQVCSALWRLIRNRLSIFSLEKGVCAGPCWSTFRHHTPVGQSSYFQPVSLLKCNFDHREKHLATKFLPPRMLLVRRISFALLGQPLICFFYSI